MSKSNYQWTRLGSSYQEQPWVGAVPGGKPIPSASICIVQPLQFQRAPSGCICRDNLTPPPVLRPPVLHIRCIASYEGIFHGMINASGYVTRLICTLHSQERGHWTHHWLQEHHKYQIEHYSNRTNKFKTIHNPQSDWNVEVPFFPLFSPSAAASRCKSREPHRWWWTGERSRLAPKATNVSKQTRVTGSKSLADKWSSPSFPHKSWPRGKLQDGAKSGWCTRRQKVWAWSSRPKCDAMPRVHAAFAKGLSACLRKVPAPHPDAGATCPTCPCFDLWHFRTQVSQRASSASAPSPSDQWDLPGHAAQPIWSTPNRWPTAVLYLRCCWSNGSAIGTGSIGFAPRSMSTLPSSKCFHFVAPKGPPHP